MPIRVIAVCSTLPTKVFDQVFTRHAIKSIQKHTSFPQELVAGFRSESAPRFIAESAPGCRPVFREGSKAGFSTGLRAQLTPGLRKGFRAGLNAGFRREGLTPGSREGSRAELSTGFRARLLPGFREGSRAGLSTGFKAGSQTRMAASQGEHSLAQDSKVENPTILDQLGWRKVYRRPPATVGMPKNLIETPALIVDLDAMDANLAKLNDLLSPFSNVRPRLHAKAHKAPQIALLQLEKHEFALGVCCQKLTEAEAMVAGGIGDVFVSNEIVSKSKLERLAVLAKSARVAVCADSSENVRDISEVAVNAGVTIQVLVEVNVGQDRCGVETPIEAVSLARKISNLPGLEFNGIQAYHGGIQHVRNRTERKAAVEKVVSKAREVVEALQAGGLDCPVVTGGGTGTFEFEAGSRVYTEVQPGSYLFGDADYARNEDNPWQQSLFVQTTVMSVNRYRGTAVIDAGLKASSFDSGPPLVSGRLGELFDVRNGGDEHGVLVPKSEGGPSEDLPKVGEVVRLVPGHCDPTVNCHDFLVGVRNGRVETLWEVSGRGPGY